MERTDSPVRSVFDCNVFLQAMANPMGPAGGCFSKVRSGDISLFVSRAILAEFVEVASRPILVRKLALSPARTHAFGEEICAYAALVEVVAPVFAHPKDPKDSMYVDLAISVGANVITSRDRHLLALRDPTDRAGIDFMSRFASIEVLTPVELLERIRGGTPFDHRG